MSNQSTYIQTFMQALAGEDGPLNARLVAIFTRILERQLQEDDAGNITEMGAFAQLLQVFTWVASTTKPSHGPSHYPASAITAARTAAQDAEPGTPVDPGNVITITAEVLNYVGTEKDDLFQADIMTITPNTVIDGKGGTDTLQAAIIGNIAPTLTSVEKVQVENVGASGRTVDTARFTGVQEYWSHESSGKLTFAGLKSATPTIGVRNTAADVEVSYITEALQGTTTVNVQLEGAMGNTVTLKRDSAVVETNYVNNVAIHSTGDTPNTLQDILLGTVDRRNDDSREAGPRALTISGDQDLTIHSASGDGNVAGLYAGLYSVINTGNMAGDLTLTWGGGEDGVRQEQLIVSPGAMSGALDLTVLASGSDADLEELILNGQNMTGAATITLGSGDGFEIDTTEIADIVIRTGAGDDVINVGTNLGNQPDDESIVINGGGGNDRLIGIVGSGGAQPVVQNVETLELEFSFWGGCYGPVAIGLFAESEPESPSAPYGILDARHIHGTQLVQITDVQGGAAILNMGAELTQVDLFRMNEDVGECRRTGPEPLGNGGGGLEPLLHLGYRPGVIGDLTLTTGQQGDTITGLLFLGGAQFTRVGSLNIIHTNHDLRLGPVLLDEHTTHLNIANQSSQQGALGMFGVFPGEFAYYNGEQAAIVVQNLTQLDLAAMSGGLYAGIILSATALTTTLHVAHQQVLSLWMLGAKDRPLTIHATTAGSGVLALGQLSIPEALAAQWFCGSNGFLSSEEEPGVLIGQGVTAAIDSADGAVTLGSIISSDGFDAFSDFAGQSSAPIVVELTSTNGAVSLAGVYAPHQGGTIDLNLEVLGRGGTLHMAAAGMFSGDTSASILADSDITIRVNSGVGEIAIASGIHSSTGTITLDITSTGGNLDLASSGGITASGGSVDITLNLAGTASHSGDIGSITGETVTLDITTGIDLTVRDSGGSGSVGSITATAEDNTGIVIDITLAGAGAVNLGTLVVSGDGNTTRIDAAALTGGLTVELAGARDHVILGDGADTITIASADHSQLDNFIRVLDFNAADDRLIIGDHATVKIGRISDTKVLDIGAVTALTEVAIAAKFNHHAGAETHGVAYFTHGSGADLRQFLLIDTSGGSFTASGDGTFVAAEDMIIEITGVTWGTQGLHYGFAESSP